MRVLDTSPRLRSIVTRLSILPTGLGPGDPRWAAGWRNLFDRYAPAMRRYVRGLLAGQASGAALADEADDVVQDYFAEALEKGWLATDGASIRCFRAYLQTQLRRFVFDHLDRKYAKKRTPRSEVSAEALESVPGRPADPADAELDRGWVETALARATERLRVGNAPYAEVIADLLATGGEGSPDLAERMGVGPEQLVHLRHRARKRLAALFHEELRETVRDPEAFEELCRALEPYLP